MTKHRQQRWIAPPSVHEPETRDELSLALEASPNAPENLDRVRLLLKREDQEAKDLVRSWILVATRQSRLQVM